MVLSPKTKYLLTQHLYWIESGYDSNKLSDLLKALRRENPFVPIKLNHLQNKIGKPLTDDFELKELDKLTYFYPHLWDFDGDISFLKYCTNLNEVDFACLKLTDIDDLKYLKNLTKLNLNGNNINSIEALTTLFDLEELNLENCNSVSLDPLLLHKKIKKITLENVEKEEDILNIISNQEVISAEYYVENNVKLQGLFFPRYLVCVNLVKEILTINMTSIVTDKYDRFFSIPSEMIADKDFVDAYIKLLESELDKRVKAILKTNYSIVESAKYYTNEEIEFGIEMRIQKNDFN